MREDRQKIVRASRDALTEGANQTGHDPIAWQLSALVATVLNLAEETAGVRKELQLGRQAR